MRVGAAGAWPSTKAALKALGASILIELAAALARDGRLDRRVVALVTAVLLALLGAASYGVSDFIGGMASANVPARGRSPPPVASAARPARSCWR